MEWELQFCGGRNLKKSLFILVLLIITTLLISVGCVRIADLSDDIETLPQQSPSLEQVQETQPVVSYSPEQVQETPPLQSQTSEQQDSIWSVNKAQKFVSRYFEDVTHIPDLDKLEETIPLYCFSVEYTVVIGCNIEVCVWINSVTQDLEFKEFFLYENIPDKSIPVPLSNGCVVSYDRFEPPYSGYAFTSYIYRDMSFQESYQEQLKETGFMDIGSVAGFDSLWVCERDEDNTALLVGFRYIEDSLLINMLVSDNTNLDYDEILCLGEF